MRLLMLTVDWQPTEGGIATLCEGLAAALARRGHELTVLAPERPGSNTHSIPPGVHVERWPGYELGPLRWFPFAAYAAFALNRHDAVLAMNPAYGGLVGWMSRFAGGPPYLAWAYGYELLKARNTPLGRLYRLMFSRARRAVAISEFTRSLLLDHGVTSEAVQIVHPGVEPAPVVSHPLEPSAAKVALGMPGGPMVFSLGRLIARKGHLALLDAMSTVVTRQPEATLAIAGRGPLEPEIRARIRALGLERNIRLLGYLTPEQLELAWTASELFVLLPASSSDDAEGFGIVYLEAAARGRAVVAGNSGGVSEAVVDGVTGILVDPSDTAAAAAAITRLLEEPELSQRMGAAGRLRAARMSWDRVAAEVEALLA